METKLVDFSEKELVFLGVILEEKIADLQFKVDKALQMPEGELRQDLYTFFSGHLEMAQQWNTKALEASRWLRARAIMTEEN
jgi:hypothetical protein